MDEKKYISIAQLAKILGISRQAVHKKVKQQKIRAIKIGRSYAIPEDFIKASMVNVKGQPLTMEEKERIEIAVKKTIEEYGEVLQLLGKG